MNSQESVTTLNTQAWALRTQDAAQARTLAEQAFSLSSAAGFDEGLADSLRTLAWLNMEAGQFAEALPQALRALQLYEPVGQTEKKADILIVLSQIYSRLENYSTALDYGLQVLTLCRRHGYVHHEALIYQILGTAYSMFGSPNEALRYFQMGMEISSRLDDNTMRARAYNNLAYFYCRMQRYAEALEPALEALKLLDKIESLSIKSATLHTLGAIYAGLEDYPQALSYLQAGMAASPVDFHRLACMIESARIEIRRGSYPQALEWLDEARVVAERLNASNSTAQIFRLYADLYKAQGDFENALAYFEKFHAAHEIAFSEQSDHRMKSLQTIHDVETARLEAEAQRQKNASLQAQIERHQQSIADLDAYADMVAHDLKNPISIITGYAELLLQDLDAVLDPQSRSYLVGIADVSGKMDELVGELLNLARVRKQEISPQPVDMEAVFRQAMRRVEHLVSRYHAAIKLKTALPAAFAYPAWVEEIWVNYLTNALKYGGQPPHIEVGAAPAASGLVRYWVRDNGDGLTPEMQAKVFSGKYERFGKFHIEGHGIGLTVVKTIVDKLGGEVGVESDGLPGHGSTFSFSLPVTG
ncbi:MAG: tetratricopeptide repeat protein [Chloroflexi bacterium]|nr:tetratricopeptide repeat protein [Chloroflexota bacterium]